MKPWREVQWVIPPAQNSHFVAQMEQVLDVYKRPYNARYPVVCMDESPRQLIRATRPALPTRAGDAARYDYEYERCGVCNVFMAVEPLASTRLVQITERKTKRQWAAFLETIAQHYAGAHMITLVMDNLNTHGPGPPLAKALWNRFEFVYTPKHGSWLNMAEIELNVLIKQCLNRRIDTMAEMQAEVEAWQTRRNNMNATINWQFTTDDARVKLKRLPKIRDGFISGIKNPR